MQIDIREADDRDNAALRSLQAQCPQGKSLVVSVVNAPDFFARAKAYATYRVFVATADGEIVGSAACAIRDAVLGDECRRFGYEFQYFTSPDLRRKGVASNLRRAMESWMIDQGTVLSSAAILEGNTPSMRLFEREWCWKWCAMCVRLREFGMPTTTRCAAAPTRS